jgi:hypothetical protein
MLSRDRDAFRLGWHGGPPDIPAARPERLASIAGAVNGAELKLRLGMRSIFYA